MSSHHNIEKEPTPKSRIFLVEDNRVFRSAVQQHLENFGSYTVIPTETAEAALALLEIDPKPSLVITDYNLRSVGGQMTGIDLARRLRTHKKEMLRKIPILLLSLEEDLDIQYPEVINELDVIYVDKDTPPEELLNAVASSLKTQS